MFRSKIKTAAYYARRPKFWAYGIERGRRLLIGPSRYDSYQPEAEEWAAERAVSAESALRNLNIVPPEQPMPPAVDRALLAEAEDARQKSGVKMGGPGDLDLLYSAVQAIKATRVIETGVAYGWSSLVILEALRNTGGQLVSVDMPYFAAGLESFVGLVVPSRLRDRWTLLREPDRNGIKKAIRILGGTTDLCHYDSDKSHAGRKYAYPLLWNSLRAGGIFISDDIQDSYTFRDFVAQVGCPFAITRSQSKFVGILVKPPGDTRVEW